ncbi:MAG: hypothetical protein QME81_05880 [bacterium]|nr:hypothetical protein [bacterium]
MVIFLLITGRVLSQTKDLFTKKITSSWEDSTRRISKVCRTLEIKEGPIIVVNGIPDLYSYFLEDVPVITGNLDSTVLDKLVKKYEAKYLIVTFEKDEEIGPVYVGERELSPTKIIEGQEFKTISFDL